jgi:hypothetical protein
MTTGTDERQTLAHLGEEQGWARRVSDGRTDVYLRGNSRVRVIWQGDDKISGASAFTDDMYEHYTRELGTVRTWLKR